LISGLKTIGASGVQSKVCPVGWADATTDAPMLPTAPGRFSTTTGCPNDWRSLSATIRHNVSVMPPTGPGTTNVTSRPGKSCASGVWAPTGGANPAAPAIARAIDALKGEIMCDRDLRIPPAPALQIDKAQRSVKPAHTMSHPVRCFN
jgi:hypothetical protein